MGATASGTGPADEAVYHHTEDGRVIVPGGVYAHLIEELDRLKADNETLRATLLTAAERIAVCSELLTRCAERQRVYRRPIHDHSAKVIRLEAGD